MEGQSIRRYDTVLPFGLRSAPKIFNALADAAQWIMGREGIDVLHYLDDFLFFGPPDMAEGRAVLGKRCQVLTKLGFPIAAHKTEGPGKNDQAATAFVLERQRRQRQRALKIQLSRRWDDGGALRTCSI